MEKRIYIRISEKEKRHAKEQAKQAGMSISALARALLAGVYIKSRADVKVLAEIKKQGGLCKSLYNAGADPKATWAALKALEKAAEKLAASI